MKVSLAAFGLVLLTAACGVPVSQGPVQQPVPVPKRSAGDRPEFPPSPRDQPPPPEAPTPDPRAPEAPPPPSRQPAAAPPAAPAAQPAVSSASPLEAAQPELLAGVLWVQTAQEYEALALQAYAAARRSLDEALEDPAWNAFDGAPSRETGRPPAIVVDVDETVLDNSPYESRLVLEGRAPGGFGRWCREERAEAVPGALEFTRYAASRGVTVFYVTNRNHDLEEATRNNLEKEGFPLGEAGEDRILTRYEREEWTSDKASRREEVARGHRILLLVGDDLNDFVSGGRGSRQEREAKHRANRERWGKEWILLPNPMYGSWMRALTWDRGEELTPEEELQLKLQALE